MEKRTFLVELTFDPEKFDPNDFEDLGLEIYEILSYLVNRVDSGLKITDVTEM